MRAGCLSFAGPKTAAPLCRARALEEVRAIIEDFPRQRQRLGIKPLPKARPIPTR